MIDGDPASADDRSPRKPTARWWFATVKRWFAAVKSCASSDRVRTGAAVLSAIAAIYGVLRGGGGTF